MPGASKHLLVVPLRPVAHPVDERAAPLHRVFAQGSLMAGVVVADPLPPERSHGVEIQSHAAPARRAAEGRTRRGIETDTSVGREICFDPGVGADGAYRKLAG